jgi:hypothetical protein
MKTLQDEPLDIAIAVFAYKRPWHLQETLHALSQNHGAISLPVYIFIDGPRSASDRSAVNDVYATASRATGFKSVTTITSTANKGLFKALTEGISEVLEKHDSVIVVEDDIVTSPHFINYMTKALILYRDEERVASVHGYTPPIKADLPETFFLRGADCWGWATWRNRWSLFRSDAGQLAMEIKAQGLSHYFNLNSNLPFMQMLEDRADCKNNSWAICWHASCFLADRLTLYPRLSLVSNIGFDHSGENCGPSDIYATKAYQGSISVTPIPLKVNHKTFIIYCNHFRQRKRPLGKVVGAIKRKLSRFIGQ